jgi:hypothetical protein
MTGTPLTLNQIVGAVDKANPRPKSIDISAAANINMGSLLDLCEIVKTLPPPVSLHYLNGAADQKVKCD